jgi:hypothetical protein
VQFRGGVPQFLRELRANPLGDWQVEMGDDDINLDCHFFGFTQLYAPDDNKPWLQSKDLCLYLHLEDEY